MPGTWVPSLVQEDPTRLGAAEPAGLNYRACALDPVLRKKRNHCNKKPLHHKEEQPLPVITEKT